LNIYDELQSMGNEKGSINVGLVGAGFMGRGIVEVIDIVPGIEVVAISDIDVGRAAACFERLGYSKIREIKKDGEVRRVDLRTERIVCADHRLLTCLGGVDFVIEATGEPTVGAEVAYSSIMQGKHVGMLNVEADVTVGLFLSGLARKTGVVYTVCAGDEPAAIGELYDFATSCGFRIVAAGKGKNNPLDLHAIPGSLTRKAKDAGLNPRLLTEFVDGTKTMVEMSCAANAIGLRVDKRNMHGPRVTLDDLPKVFSLKKSGGILSHEGVVDYALGDIAPGVFVVVRHSGKIANQTLRYLKIGTGPNYLLYRPYHLTNLEVPRTIAWAVLYGKATLQTSRTPTTEVITIAKRDLKAGEVIDCIGGDAVYGGIENYKKAAEEHLLPIGLVAGAKLLVDVRGDYPIRTDQVKVGDSMIHQFRKIQDSMHE
jgi:predicted homoserine dehydrogenase-like protein